MSMAISTERDYKSRGETSPMSLSESYPKSKGVGEESGMDVICGRLTSTLNPFAAPYVPAAYRAVEDFSDDWWGLVKSTPWFRDYWLRECFEQEEEELDRTDLDFLDICDDNTDSLFYSLPSLMSREGEEMKSKMEVAVLGAEKWRGPRGVMAGPRNCDKAVKIVNMKVSPRMIQQPR